MINIHFQVNLKNKSKKEIHLNYYKTAECKAVKETILI